MERALYLVEGDEGLNKRPNCKETWLLSLKNFFNYF